MAIPPFSEHPGRTTPPGEVAIYTGSLVSILIPCCGMLEYTKLCVPSVIRFSQGHPFELIFLDIGSLDGTAEYLSGVETVNPQIPVQVIRAATDLDIKDACKQAVGQARGEYLVLLNNDTIVTANWLKQLIGLMSFSPTIGAVGPMSNYAAEPQRVDSIPYRSFSLSPASKVAAAKTMERRGAKPRLVDVEAVHAFASEFAQQNRGKWLSDQERLGGFSLMIKRETLSKIGPLDPWSDLGLFDTDILSLKAREAGYSLAVCRDLFIHHFGTRTFTHGAPKPDAVPNPNGKARP